jgi:hypothetical protein
MAAPAAIWRSDRELVRACIDNTPANALHTPIDIKLFIVYVSLYLKHATYCSVFLTGRIAPRDH